MKRIFIFVVLAIVIGVGWYWHALWPVNRNDSVRVAVEIPTGAGASKIAQILAEKDLIRSPLAFRIYAKMHRVSTGLKAGGMFLHRDLSVPEIIETLQRGYGEEASLTIPEGYTVADIDRLLAEKGIAKAGEIIACAKTCDFSVFAFLPKNGDLAKRGGKIEGYLFPDTYFVIRDTFSAKAFLERLITTFEKRVVTGLKSDIASSGHSLQEIVTMASIIEEETKTDEERPVVSGILWKRIEGKTGLYVDASTRYILEKPKEALTDADLKFDSPYNTRKYRGLPPGPIANAGLMSIKAALHPEESDYLYYLHDAKGVIHYAKTNDEQNENRARYLR